MKNFIFLCIAAMAVLSVCAVAVETNKIRTEIEINWIDENRFDILETDTDVTVEVLNASDSRLLSDRTDIGEINQSNYNAFDRIIRIEFDADKTFTCSGSQIDNITNTVDRLVSYCANYQTFINGTVQYADRMAEWQGEATRLKEVVRQKDEDIAEKDAKITSLETQMTGCVRDKENYYSDWQTCDKDLGISNRDLQGAKDSFAGKYLIGAIIGGAAIYIFTRKNDGAPSEETEFQEVD